ncbi:MAG: hypothetical protein QM486_04160 [Flavobacteriaceae bacterium]
MELVNIEKLIEKYFEGETNLNEEAQLRTYFTSQKVPAHLEAYQDLFGYFEAKANESFKKPLLPVKKVKVPYKWLSVAASIALLISVFMYNKNETKKEQLAQSYQSTQEALQLISKNINKGAFAMVQLGEFEKTKTMVFKENK